ncbi:hypothetical protein BDF14DRAFT_595034 [Spinellus fusiger]|nr:hypothetical protein BDF14DRAFT_595034 [Spinellus fusiger]
MMESFSTSRSIQVLGNSSLSTLFRQTIDSYHSSATENTRIVAIDRSDRSLHKIIKNFRKSRNVIMIEFSAIQWSSADVPPATIIFPRKTGGFITTDAYHIVMSPMIIQKMVDYVDKDSISR